MFLCVQTCAHVNVCIADFIPVVIRLKLNLWFTSQGQGDRQNFWVCFPQDSPSWRVLSIYMTITDSLPTSSIYIPTETHTYLHTQTPNMHSTRLHQSIDMHMHAHTCTRTHFLFFAYVARIIFSSSFFLSDSLKDFVTLIYSKQWLILWVNLTGPQDAQIFGQTWFLLCMRVLWIRLAFELTNSDGLTNTDHPPQHEQAPSNLLRVWIEQKGGGKRGYLLIVELQHLRSPDSQPAD